MWNKSRKRGVLQEINNKLNFKCFHFHSTKYKKKTKKKKNSTKISLNAKQLKSNHRWGYWICQFLGRQNWNKAYNSDVRSNICFEARTLFVEIHYWESFYQVFCETRGCENMPYTSLGTFAVQLCSTGLWHVSDLRWSVSIIGSPWLVFHWNEPLGPWQCSV